MKRIACIFGANTVLLLLAAILILGCGGSGGDGGGLPPERPIAINAGYAVDAVIEGGTVSAYSWKNGIKGDLLGTAVTDEKGYYTIPLQVEGQPLLLELTGGAYTEEASGRRVSLRAEQILRAAVNYGGSGLSLMITPYTTLAVGLAEYYIENQGYNVENALTVATSEITGITVFNILDEYPVNITLAENQSGALTDGHMYGFFCAALSSWSAELSELNGTATHDAYNSIFLAQMMYQDVRYDGVLNGYGVTGTGRPGNLMVGTEPLDSQEYRLKIGHHIIKAAGADYNQTGLTVEDVLTQAQQFSQRVNALFGNEDPLPLDTEGPRVYQTEPIGQQYRGEVDYSFRIVDPVGIDTIAVNLDGDPLSANVSENATDEDIIVTINTNNYTDGDYLLEVVSADLLGNESTNELPIVINNAGILLNVNEMPEITNEGAIDIAGTYETTGTTIETITVNGNPATIQQANNTYSALFTLQSGTNTIEIVATDNIGNETTVTRTVDCDRVAPTIETGDDHGYHRFYIGGEDVTSLTLHDENTGHPLYYTYQTTSLNGVEINREDLFAAEIPFFTFTTSDSADNGVLTQPEDLLVEMTYTRPGYTSGSRTLFPVDGTTDEYIIPLVTEYLDANYYQASEGDMHTITVRTIDRAGNGTAKILSFKVYIEAGEANIQSLTNGSVVTVYTYDNATRGGIIAQTETDDNGAVTIKMITVARPVLIELTGGSYTETGTGGRIQFTESQRLSAVFNYEEEDLNISITPLTTVATSLSALYSGSTETTREAIDAANQDVSDIYGVDIINSQIINIADPVYATSICTDDYRHSFTLAGISRWTRDAAEQNGAYGQQHYNSILMTERMAADIGDDGTLNGGQTFGAVNIDQNVYQTGFGSATIDVINSYRNMTQLTVEQFLGFAEVAHDTGYEDSLNVSFANRSSVYGNTLTINDIDVTSQDQTPILVRINGTGGLNDFTHQYFDAQRIHTIEETLSRQYRARPSEFQPDNYGDWQTITSYETYEGEQWTPSALPPGHTRQYNHPSDTLPENVNQDWHYFITEALGDMHIYHAGPIDSTMQRIGVGAVDYRFAAESYACYKYAVGHRSAIPEQDFWRDVTATPEIQRTLQYQYTTIDGPRIDENHHTDNHIFSNSISAHSDTNPVQLSGGYYIIEPQQTVKFSKSTTLPVVEVYSSGEPTYDLETYDQSCTWVINAGLTYLASRATDVSVATQAPHYQFGQTGTSTHTVSR